MSTESSSENILRHVSSTCEFGICQEPTSSKTSFKTEQKCRIWKATEEIRGQGLLQVFLPKHLATRVPALRAPRAPQLRVDTRLSRAELRGCSLFSSLKTGPTEVSLHLFKTPVQNPRSFYISKKFLYNPRSFYISKVTKL